LHLLGIIGEIYVTIGEKLKASILYVEDEVITRRMVNGILQRRFAVVFEAKDGREGLELFRKNNPDIVITDSKMPAMDGIEMSRIIKSLKPEIPIIFTSAYEEPEFMETLDEIGVKWKFVKPIDVKELLNTLESICLGMKYQAQK
jgi:YesN/AraC family two-component response regulator